MSSEGVTKSDLCWVLVKFAGAVLTYQGVSALYTMALTWWQLPEFNDEWPKLVQMQLMTPVKIMFLSSLLPLAVGLRLLASGALLHRLLMQIPLGFSADGSRSLVETRLEGDELEAFRNWIKENSELRKRDEIDQLSLFRDAQKKGEL